MIERLKNIFWLVDLRTRAMVEKFTLTNKRAYVIIGIFTFFITLFSVYTYIGVFKVMNERPAYIHFSAQCQRASVALTYYKSGMNFFLPKTHRTEHGDGITGVEFPIIYYLGAIAYKLFGFNEMYLRIISLICVVFGLFYFYKLSNYFTKSNIISMMFVLAGTLSPVFLTYTPNFLPDAPSMCVGLIGWYFFFKFQNTGKTRDLNLFAVYATLAILIKSVAALMFGVIICLIVLDRLRFFKTKDSEYYLKDHGRILKRIFIGLCFPVAWYLYATWLTNHYQNPAFALQVMMVDSMEGFKEVISFIKGQWLMYYYAYEGYVLIIAALAVIIVGIKYANRVLFSITILYMIGSAFYVFLFLNQFRNHDYYIIAMLPGVFFLLLTLGEMVCRFADEHLLMLRLVLMVVLFFNIKESVVYCKKMYEQRNSREIYYWSGDYSAYEDLEPKLRKAGIKRTDKFIVAFDESYLGSLYLMDQLGVAIMGWQPVEVTDKFMKDEEMKYLVLNDSARFNKFYPNKLQSKIMMYHRGLIIYKLR